MRRARTMPVAIVPRSRPLPSDNLFFENLTELRSRKVRDFRLNVSQMPATS
ncbi:MAG: hypothetical protein JGK28_12095 [Microcoleus sp. PH2017_07_MST_O_A]|uniref:hypothetical protein n=1 Tax=Microcoleus sp. PH2017_28_MFU_U_A TaxID=2798838 RepID=UPI001E092033|nr:hypothetical protein [Microcoleus sp. PH2017_28_MFU_U_A]MCC3418673.1 hypothetical protein [Microcoleus sp. PH2017_07_MST_O_A]MCC3593013.1 hypothetical protein [Microcoleus sp. PH2017_28_MFU_U_A]